MSTVFLVLKVFFNTKPLKIIKIVSNAAHIINSPLLLIALYNAPNFRILDSINFRPSSKSQFYFVFATLFLHMLIGIKIFLDTKSVSKLRIDNFTISFLHSLASTVNFSLNYSRLLKSRKFTKLIASRLN